MSNHSAAGHGAIAIPHPGSQASFRSISAGHARMTAFAAAALGTQMTGMGPAGLALLSLGVLLAALLAVRSSSLRAGDGGAASLLASAVPGTLLPLAVSLAASASTTLLVAIPMAVALFAALTALAALLASLAALVLDGAASGGTVARIVSWFTGGIAGSISDEAA